MFLSEVRSADGSEFPAKTLYCILIMLQIHFDKMGKSWKLVDGSEFVSVKNTLNNLMKDRSKKNVGSNGHAADPISFEAEKTLWKTGLLGEENPSQLRDTVMFLVGLMFALQDGEEQCQLRGPGFKPQIEVLCDQSGKKFLQYTEDMCSKFNQGGLKHKWVKPKVVCAYGNERNDRNLVRLYEKYCTLLPANPKTSALYKYPICPPRVWYTDKPLGMNKVRDIVKNMMNNAGIDGRFTNHSLRITAAMHMYARGVDEQVIKERTGHKSDAVQAYKRTDNKLLR